jgi:hypothetical protein
MCVAGPDTVRPSRIREGRWGDRVRGRYAASISLRLRRLPRAT